METNIKLKNQAATSAPKINAVDMLAGAKPIRLNKVPEETPQKVEQKSAQSKLSTIDTTNVSKVSSLANQAYQTKPVQQPQAKPESITAESARSINNIGNISKEELIKIQQEKLQAKALRRRQLQEAIAKKTKETIVQQNAHNETNHANTSAAKTTLDISNNEIPLKQDSLKIDEATKEETTNVIDNSTNIDNTTNISPEVLQQNASLQQLVVKVDELDFAITKKVRGYLKKLISVDGSDLHLKAGGKIRARIHGDIVIFSDEIFSKDDAITFAKELTRTRFQEFALNKEFDMTYIYDSSTRFRVNMFFQMEGVSFAFRRIPAMQNTIAELGLPEAIGSIVNMERGLVLVTGVTGSGKSTTLAAIINEINHRHAKHIITIEDPIEFIHKDVKSIINQRSIGMDTNSFAQALKAALREDPDIILVGEMRDVETIDTALHAAETGHLVLSTLHTLDAKETINRIISVFPANDQVRIRMTLASTLNSIISQRLMKARNGGRTAAIELLFKTPRIEMIINEGRDGDILEALAEGSGVYHTQTFDQHLFELVINGLVDEEVAMEKATSPSDLKLRLQNVSSQDREDDGGYTISIKK